MTRAKEKAGVKRTSYVCIESYEQFKGTVRYKTCKKTYVEILGKSFKAVGSGIFFPAETEEQEGSVSI